MTDDAVLIYVPREGEYIAGLPQRDLTAADVAGSDPSLLRDGVASGLYVSPPKTSKTAEIAAKDGDE